MIPNFESSSGDYHSPAPSNTDDESGGGPSSSSSLLSDVVELVRLTDDLSHQGGGEDDDPALRLRQRAQRILQTEAPFHLRIPAFLAPLLNSSPARRIGALSLLVMVLVVVLPMSSSSNGLRGGEKAPPDPLSASAHAASQPVPQSISAPASSPTSPKVISISSSSSSSSTMINHPLMDSNTTVSIPSYTLAKLQEMGSPQARAYSWMSQDYPPSTLRELPEWRKQQVFAMATLYYSLEGPSWPQHEQELWLNATTHECHWVPQPTLTQEIECSPDTLAIIGLQLPRYGAGKIPPQTRLLSSLQSLIWHGADSTAESALLSAVLPSRLDSLQQLQIHGCNLTGTIPTHLYNLPNLEKLVLQDNSLTGTVSPRISHLQGKLEFLRISGNEGLTGTIPTQVGALSRLTSLGLHQNSLTGSIPTQVGLLSLDWLGLHENRLAGSIPTQLGRATKLGFLYLQSNGGHGLSGPIPSQLGKATLLKMLHLDSNSLTGKIPTQLGNMKELQELGLFLNSLTGPIPSQLGLLKQARRVILGHNRLTGSLPTQLGQLARVQLLFLDNNTLSGPIPSQLGNAANLGVLALGFNKLTGSLPSQLGQLSNLNELGMYNNSLVGSLPSQLGLLQENLKHLYLENNDLSGTLPTELGLLLGNGKLDMFNIHNNSLSGTIPAELFVSKNQNASSPLTQLWMTRNRFEGTIPSHLGLLTNLVGLGLGHNKLYRDIPTQLGQLTRLERLDLESNSLSVALPSQLGRLTNLKLLDVQKNRLQTSVPTQLGMLTSLELIILYNNSFSGTIPTQLGRLTAVTGFDLASNHLSGSIPSQLGLLQNTKELYLCNNTKLTGTIPPQLGLLTGLQEVWLQQSHLSGSVPEGLCDLAKAPGFKALHVDCQEVTCPTSCPCTCGFLGAPHSDTRTRSLVGVQQEQEERRTTSNSAPTKTKQFFMTIIDEKEETDRVTEAQESTQSTEVVNLVLTEATLLSGKLDECNSITDEDCEAGVAAVAAFLRHLNPTDAPSLVFPKFEKQSQFVQVHPLGWSVNRLILQGLFGWKILQSTPFLLLQNKRDGYGSPRDLTYLQDANFPFLITNVNVPPSSSWATHYHEYVHFDERTRIALLCIANSGEPMNHDQIQSAWGALYTIADENKALNCVPSSSADPEKQALFDAYEEIYSQSSTSAPNNQRCWTPVVLFDDSQPGKFQQFIQGVMEHPYPPQLIIDVDGNAPDEYPMPTLVKFQQSLLNTTSTRSSNEKSVWIHSIRRKDDIYYQHQLHLSQEFPQTLVNVTLIQEDMEVLPVEYRDELYARHIAFLREQADQAIQNDPVAGYSTAFPVAREGEIRRCQGGECEIGNLFVDAMRWKAKADVAFTASGGLRGDGWPAGPVHVSSIWASLPFPNGLCTGVMSGSSLFKLLDYSISIATFEAWDTNDGERLLQVSGMQVEYNTEIPKDSPRIVAVRIWDHDQQEWSPIERLRLYKFATDSYLCGAYNPYPDLLGANGQYTLQGEVPGAIGDDLVQDVVAQYLQQLGAPYDAAIKGRLLNNTESFEVLNLVETEETCVGKVFWSQKRSACFPCPDTSHVDFSDDRLEFYGQQSAGGIIPTDESKDSSIFNATMLNLTDSNLLGSVLQGRILLVNRELSNFSVVPKSIPSWLKFVDSGKGQLSDRFVVGGPPTFLPSGSSLALDFLVGNENLQSGTAVGTVSFGVLGRDIDGDEGIQACDDYSRDATFDVFLSVTPPEELNAIGNFRIIGLSLMAITLTTAIAFGIIIYRFRATAILKTMQPMFLCTICIGIFIIALAILPMSLDDQSLSEGGADAACMATPWLLSMGLTVTFSALFSKLWRVNQLFRVQSFRRKKVTATDVLTPFALLFTLNTVLLTTWNVLDPLRSVRLTVPGEPWKSYESCRAGTVGYAFMYSAAGVNGVALLLACFQAYQARNISGEFAESKALGLAIACWLQVLLVGFPALYLVDDDDITASYFLRVGLLFVLCMSMMCIIFGPLLLMLLQYRKNPRAFMNRRATQGGSVFVSGYSQHGSASQLGNTSFYENNSLRRSQGFDVRGSQNKLLADPSDGSNNTRTRQGMATGDLSASGSSIGGSDTYGIVPHNLMSIREEFHDEEAGDDQEQARRKSAQERAPSTHSTERLETHTEDDAAESISASSSNLQGLTDQMLLDDLVPREAIDSFNKLQESYSSVPFGGNGSAYFQENALLGNHDSDSDSSVPFQGKGSGVDCLDGSESSHKCEHIVERNEYSKYLQQTSAPPVYDNSTSSALQETRVPPVYDRPARPVLHASPETKEDNEAVTNVEASLAIATIEHGRATRTREMPFSSRFVDYKSRLTLLEQKQNSAPEGSALSVMGDSVGSMGGAETSMRDHSSASLLSEDRMARSDPSNNGVAQRRMVDNSDPTQVGEGRKIMSGKSDPMHLLQPREEDYTRRRSNQDYSRREKQTGPRERFPWEEKGRRASGADMLGYSLTDEWQGPDYKKKEKGLKGTISALHNSFSALSFSPAGAGGSKDNGSDSPRKPTKLSNPLAALNMSLPALHFNHNKHLKNRTMESSASVDLYEDEPRSSTP